MIHLLAIYQLLDPQAPSDELHVGEPCALAVSGNFKHAGGKILFPLGPGSKPPQSVQQLADPVHLQGRAKKAGEKLPPPDQPPQGIIREPLGLHIFLQGLLVPQGSLLPKLICTVVGEVRQTVGGEGRAQFIQQRLLLYSRLIHLIEEKKGGYAVAPQQLPERPRVALGSVGA